MSAKSAGMYRLQLIALTLMLAAASAQGQSAWAYADVYYDAATDRVIANTTTLVDYSTEYYYSPKVQVSLSGSDGSYVWWYCPYAGAGACTNGGYAFGDVSANATPGVTYTVQGYHTVAIYYYYYEANPGCTWGCYQWYDALGYSTGYCSSACQEDPNCFCVEVWGAPYNRSYAPPWVIHLAFIAEQILGDTSKQATTQQASLSCTPSAVTRGSNVNCTVSGPGSTRVTDWSFTGGGGNVSGPPGVTWGGTMVQSGTISAKAAGVSLTAQNITVNPRSAWATSPKSASEDVVPNCPTYERPPRDSSSTLGCSNYSATWNGIIPTVIHDGPNNDFAYYAINYTQDAQRFVQSFPWSIHPDVKSLTSSFMIHQYGQCGFISRNNLRDNVIWHESSSSPRSHYAQYVTALQANNYGIYLESRVAINTEDKNQFNQATVNGIQSRWQTIWAAAGVETDLFESHQNQSTAASMGLINYPYPYPDGYQPNPCQ